MATNLSCGSALLNPDFDVTLKEFNQERFKEYIQQLTHFISAEETCGVLVGSERSKKLAAAFNLRGLIKYKLVNFDEAQNDYTRAIYYNESSLYYYNRGTIFYRMGDMDEALLDFDKCKEMDPDFREVIIAIERVRSIHGSTCRTDSSKPLT